MRLLLATFVLFMPLCVSGQIVLGVCTHFGHGGRDVKRSLELTSRSGFSSIRDEVLWSHVERSSGQFSFDKEDDFIRRASILGLRPLVILGYGNDIYGTRNKPLDSRMSSRYEEYVKRVVSRYRGMVWGYEIWNEYDGKAGRYPAGDFRSYAELVNKVSRIIKTADPSATVLVGALTPLSVENGWLTSFARLIEFTSIDGVSIHPYAQGRVPPEKEVEFAASLVRKTVDELRAVGFIGRGKRGRVYVTEIGWQSSSGITERQAAQNIHKFLDLMKLEENVGGVWFYELENSGGNLKDGEHNYGFFENGLGRQRYMTFNN